MVEDDLRGQARFGIIAGLVLQAAGSVLLRKQQSLHPIGLGMILYVAGTTLIVWGSLAFARLKGYPSALGAVGVLSFIGVLILALLPRRGTHG